MEFLKEEIAEYAEAYSQREPDLLQELNRETQAKILYPRMLSGHLQGRFLSAISRMIKPQHVLEIGTYTGYSALCLAEGLAPGGKIITLDVNDELHDIAMRYFGKAGLENTIDLINGNALEIIPTLKQEFDLVFIDADKINYSNYFRLVFPLLKKGGWILADNVLWSGNVLQDESRMDPDTKAIHEFNCMVRDHRDVISMLLPLRDGLFLIQKK